MRTAKLPSELRKQKNKSIGIRIGRKISVKEQSGYPDIEHYTAFLRQRTYLLSQALSPSKKLFPLHRPHEAQEIIPPVDSSLIEKEIDELRNSDSYLFTQKNYDLFVSPSKKIPSVLMEVGRLREITFREVGEGSNLPLDLDEYDYHYEHLILWDNEEKQLAGAYRLGIGSEIFKRFGIKGFYVNSLFKVDEYANEMFSQSLEMGRAFIVKSQQQKPLPLFLLWKGIVQVILRHPELKYITGCASISNSFSRFSKSLMVEYLTQHYGDEELAHHIRPRKPFKPKLDEKYRQLVFESSQDDLNKFDRIIEEIEPGERRFPILIKKYLKQNSHIVCFNVDPLFNDSLDGFMYIKMDDLPEGTLEG